MRRHNTIRWLVAVLVAALALATGCSNSGTGPDDGEDTGYPDQSTPDNVIEKLEMAYEGMDADAYLECLAADFAFFLNLEDIGEDPTLPEYWDKQEEEIFHRHMFADTTVIESIVLTMTVVSTDSLPGADPGDPIDDLWEYEVAINLRVSVQPWLTVLAEGMSRFVLRRSPDRDDAVWQIVEHHDLGDEWIQREESTSWTRIKLAFGGPAADSLYPIRSSPENVLDKLTLAYIRMDAEAYLDCLAEDFIFFLSPDDVNDDPALPDHWDRVEEAIIHGNMFGEDTDVGGIMLVMTTNSASYDEGDPGDPLDDTWTYREDYDIRMQLPPDLTLHAQAPCEFTLGIDPDETGHGGQLLWEITRWYDLHVDRTRSGEPVVEHASWGCIKALFR